MGTKALAERLPLYSLNVDTANALSAAALTSFVVAEAARRPHLRDAIVSFAFSDGNLMVVVQDAGQREHLANALALPREKGAAVRRGNLVGIDVTICTPASLP